MTRASKHYPKNKSIGAWSGFTIFELVLVVAIFMIVTSAVVFIINPGKVFKRSRDAIRASDVSGLNKAISLHQLDNPGITPGKPKTVYLSIPDPAATTTAGTNCGNFGLPPPDPADWTYHCPHPATFRSAEGSGWIPIDFSAISAGQPFAALPVDPANTASTSYYVFTADDSGGSVTLARASSNAEESGFDLDGRVVVGFFIFVGIIAILSVLASLY